LSLNPSQSICCRHFLQQLLLASNFLLCLSSQLQLVLHIESLGEILNFLVPEDLLFGESHKVLRVEPLENLVVSLGNKILLMSQPLVSLLEGLLDMGGFLKLLKIPSLLGHHFLLLILGDLI
jgi:hypothetical protein